MKKYSLLTALLIVTANLAALCQTTCDYFNEANSTIVNGWTEQSGDWAVSNNALQSPAATSWNFITFDGSSQADGCITARVTHNGIAETQFMGLVARYTSDVSNLMVKVQDNSSAGYWNSYFIYCNDINISNGNTGLNFGNDIYINLEYVGPNVTLRIDTDMNGTWDYTYTTMVSNTGAGLCGAASFQQCYLDDWCYSPGCCITPPDPAGSLTGSALVCTGQNGVSYSVPVINGATAYVWNYSGTGATIIGSGNNVSINFSAGASSGTLSVYGNNTCGSGTASTDFQITVVPCTGVNAVEAMKNVQVFPNPGPGLVSVIYNLEKNMNCSIKVHDVTGRIIYASDQLLYAGQNQFELDLRQKPAGIYYLNIINDKSVIVKALVIAK
jgi:hypothetical protein